MSGKSITHIITDDRPRKVYVFRPGEEVTIEFEYIVHETRLPVGSFIYDPQDSTGSPWTVQKHVGQAIVSLTKLPPHLRAYQLILPVPE